MELSQSSSVLPSHSLQDPQLAEDTLGSASLLAMRDWVS